MEEKPNQSGYQQQLLYHDGLQHNNLNCSDLEVIPNRGRLYLETASLDGGKEAFATDISRLEVQSDINVPQIEGQPQTLATGKSRGPQSFSRKWLFIIALAIIAVCFVVISVSIFETRKHRSKSDSLVDSSASPSAASTASSSPASSALPLATPFNVDPELDLATAGALNGTSLTALLPMDQTDWVLLFFQHESADIKYTRKSTDNTWQASEIIGGVPKPMNKTSLAGVYYETEPGGKYATWQLYYMDLSGVLQNIYNVDATNNWTTGSLGGHSFQASRSPGAALAADASPWYGSKPNVGLGGIRLLTGGNDSLVHEYTYTIESDVWEAGFTFPNSNGNAGVSITHYSALSEVVLVNSQGQLEYWWRDDDISKVNSSSYYFGIWNKGATSVATLHPDSAICTSNLTYIQDPTNSILTVDRQDANKHARWGPTTNVSSSDAGAVLSGSSLACNTQEAQGSPHTFYTYFQNEGGHVVEYGKGLTDTAWTLDHAPS